MAHQRPDELGARERLELEALDACCGLLNAVGLARTRLIECDVRVDGATNERGVLAAETIGATVLVPPTDSSAGRFALLRDPTGAVFSVITAGQTS